LSDRGLASSATAPWDKSWDKLLLPLIRSHGHHVFRCEVTVEATHALSHAREVVNYAERTGSQLARIFSFLQIGLANVLNGTWREALEVLGTALTIGRERRLWVTEGRVLAALAAAQLGLGDPARP
jgi:hypothetical protein